MSAANSGAAFLAASMHPSGIDSGMVPSTTTISPQAAPGLAVTPPVTMVCKLACSSSESSDWAKTVASSLVPSGLDWTTNSWPSASMHHSTSWGAPKYSSRRRPVLPRSSIWESARSGLSGRAKIAGCSRERRHTEGSASPDTSFSPKPSTASRRMEPVPLLAGSTVYSTPLVLLCTMVSRRS